VSGVIIPKLISERIAEAVQEERQRCADVVFVYEIRSYERDDAGFVQFRQDVGDAILGKFRAPIEYTDMATEPLP